MAKRFNIFGRLVKKIHHMINVITYTTKNKQRAKFINIGSWAGQIEKPIMTRNHTVTNVKRQLS